MSSSSPILTHSVSPEISRSANPRNALVRALVDAWPVWGVAIAYIVVIALLYPLYCYRSNPDGTAYLSLARKWSEGDWKEAINGYWAPLLVWLLAAFGRAGLGAYASVTVLNAFAGLLTLAGLDSIGRFLGFKTLRRLLVLAVSCVWLVHFAFADITPDSLTCALVIWYLALAITGDYLRSPVQAGLTGLVTGFAYLAKPYALWFILLHLTIATVVHLRSQRARDWPRIVRRMALLFAVAAVVAGPWIVCLSAKHGRLTTSTASSFVFRSIGAQRAAYDAGEDIAHRLAESGVDWGRSIGLMELPNSTAFNPWEDPQADELKLPNWSPVESWNSFRFYIAVLGGNARQSLIWYLLVSIGSIPLMGIALWQWRRSGAARPAMLLGISLFLYPMGYVATLVCPRYLWPTALLLILALGYATPSRRLSLIGMALLGLTFLPYPLVNLANARHIGEKEYLAGSAIRRCGLTGRTASLEQWHRSLSVSYFAGLQYCGVAAPGPAKRISGELHRHSVQYLLIWPDSGADPDLLSEMREIRIPGSGGARIFAVPHVLPAEYSGQAHPALVRAALSTRP